jgi:hypothetical protein
VRRQRDATDKRRLVLVARPDAVARASLLYREQGEAMAAFLEAYSERDFDLLMAFLNEVGEILARSQSSLLKTDGAPTDSPGLKFAELTCGKLRRDEIL